MTYTKGTFEMVARGIRDTLRYESEIQPQTRRLFGVFAQRMAEEFARTNPRFDEERFIAACDFDGSLDGRD